MQFACEAMREDGSTVVDTIEAGDRDAALDSLREKGLIVLRVEEKSSRGLASGPRPRAAETATLPRSSKMTTRDRILFTRQMKMLLEAGAPLVPALEAVGQQTAKPAVRTLLARLREAVEEGDSLSEALEREGQVFDPVFRSMVAAGEATATLPQAFGRLSVLAEQQQRVRKMVIGALLYPLILSLLLTGVVNILLFFVVPRFHMLFASLRSPLPFTTKLLFGLSEYVKHDWPYLLGGLVAAAVAVTVCVRLPGTRAWLDQLLLRFPVVGRLLARLILARVVRVWAAMLRCHVPLLDAIRQSRDATSNVAFLALIAQVEEAVSSGGRVAQALGAARLADPIIVSAIRTGEENGRLAEAVDFVSGWMDEDNAHVVQSLTRLAEPLLLAVMGLVVGFVAMSLFIPLFDLATAAG
jgi:type II secretory pathway component PulF